MKILVTGAKGFIGKNLIAELNNRGFCDILKYDVDTPENLLDEYCKSAEVVFHLAGINRPLEQSEFMEVNLGFTTQLISLLKKHNNKCRLIVSSSIQANLDNPYGKSKKAAEDILAEYAEQTSSKVRIFRLPNVFGKWCRPNYNSAVATFCNNIANDLPITVNDPSVMMTLVYIDDVIEDLIASIEDSIFDTLYCNVRVSHKLELGKIADLIRSFRDSRKSLFIPDMSDAFVKKIYSTYLSYLPENEFIYDLLTHSDARGSFTEFAKTCERGQFSINVAKPGIVKGNHWHNTKNEKFLVISGKAVIRFRKIDSDNVIEYFVSSDHFQVVDIPVGYTHNIENIGNSDLVTVMWANELFDPDKPDTYVAEV